MTSGAKFHRGDLHIHSYGSGGSYDVRDTLMTPENIVNKAIEKDLSIISITDHNKIANSIAAVTIAEEKGILAIPGIEISTTQGHLLAYFPTSHNLENFYGKLTFDDEKKFCSQGIYDCLEHVEKYDGIGILAHIEVDSGFEKTIGKFNEIFDRAFQHKSIIALEIKQHESQDYYTENDSNVDRKNAMKRRNQKLDLPENHKLAKVMSSDAHTMNAFGKNDSGTEKLTRFKLDELSFQSLRIALLSQDSRIRLEDDIPNFVPRFTKVQASGGVLDGLDILLSSNMNCIIGGRGTGKSTLVTAIQEASNNPVTSTKVQKSKVWPSCIHLEYEDEVGRKFKYKLQHGKVECYDDQGQLIDQKVAIEAYSQGYTTFTNHDDDTKDEKLLSFFDSFIDLDHLKRSENSQIIQLESNFDRLEKISLEVEQKHDVEKHLSELNSKKDAYEKQNVGELMKLHSGLVEEEELRKQLETSLGGLSTKYKQVLSDKSDIDDLLQLDQTKVQVGKEHVDKVLEIVRDFSSIVDDHQKSLNSALEEKLILLRDEVKEWRKKEKNATEEIDKIKAKLDQDKIPYDESKFVLLSEDIAKYNKRKKEIEKSESDLSDLKKERMSLLKGRKRILADIHNKRLAFCARINKALAASVDGLFVNAKINEGYLSKDFSSFLKQEMGWHRWQNSDCIAEKYSPLDFYDLIKRKKLSNLSPLGLSATDIQDIEQRFTNLKAQQLLSITFEERPKLTVTHHDKISGQATTKDISELSLGQQQSIMLSILIQSDSSLPLIIDQPEDNLDSEFIFNSVVTNLRQCKEKRQVILVTHNSNIGVLGDAELVIPLVASNTKSTVVDSGSIDSSSTQHQCCQILEGGKRAFRTRKDIYGI